LLPLPFSSSSSFLFLAGSLFLPLGAFIRLTSFAAVFDHDDV
jgi:hypothetical protein